MPDEPQAANATAATEDTKKKGDKDGFTFTKPGCRTEVRFGILLVLATAFFYLWLANEQPILGMLPFLTGIRVLLVLLIGGIALTLYGVPRQALDARRSNRPGFPTLMGFVLLIFGGMMTNDTLYREGVGDGIHVQPMPLLIFCTGIWILAWWPVAHLGRKTGDHLETSTHAA